MSVDWTPYKGAHWTEPCDTRVPMKTLKALGRKVAEMPEGFKLHPRVEKVMAERRAMADGKLPLDWGMGETLAYATLLDDGYGVRLSGEDSGRGTFSHRHAVLHDQSREKWDSGTYVPLEHVKPEPAGVRGDRLGAGGIRRARLRVRLRHVRSEAPRDLGGAVRRLRQRRAGDHRPVHRVGRSEVGPDLRAHAAACRTATRARAPSIRRRGPSATCSCAPSTTCRSACRPRRRRSITCCAGRCCARSAGR